MKRRHLPQVLLLLLLSLISLSFRCRLLLPQPSPSPPPPSARPAAGDPLLHRLTAEDVGSEQVLADAAALFVNGSIYTFPSLGNAHRLLYLRLPYVHSSRSPPWPRTVSRLHVPAKALPSDDSLLASFRTSLHSFLLAHNRHHRGGGGIGNVAGVMSDLGSSLLGPPPLPGLTPPPALVASPRRPMWSVARCRARHRRHSTGPSPRRWCGGCCRRLPNTSMEMVAALCERSVQQCVVIGALAERVDALEHAVRQVEEADRHRRRSKKLKKDGKGNSKASRSCYSD